jgi:signal transduction histidine kinase
MPKLSPALAAPYRIHVMAEPTMVAHPADPPDPSHDRVERIAAIGRLVFLTFTFIALSFDPSQPHRYATFTYTLLLGYIAYAAAVTAFTFWRAPALPIAVATHVFDLFAITALMYLTEWTTSPFFVYYTFALVVATMRWQWRGVLWTAVAVLVAFNVLGAWAARGLHDPTFELNRFIIRDFYLLVTSTLLGYLGYFESELRAELAHRIKKAAADDERVRLARDLHDGVLQTLTGTALQLQAAGRLVERDPAQARTVLEDLQKMIADEQRDLRFFIQELKPGQTGMVDEGTGFVPALQDLGRRLESVWGVRLELPAYLPRLTVSDAFLGEIYRIVQEAAVNAARHGQATRVTVDFGVADKRLAIAVTDNGHGFPFHGRVAHEVLAGSHQGPRSLRERVTALGGTLDIESDAGGSRLDIRLPLAPAGA